MRSYEMRRYLRSLTPHQISFIRLVPAAVIVILSMLVSSYNIRALEDDPGWGKRDLSGIGSAAVPNVSDYLNKKLRDHIICIDPGHQDHGMSDTEPIGPGASETKAKLTTGTSGIVTGNTEYKINLQIGLKLKDELIRRGYKVVMTRTSDHVEISNAERAVMAAEADAELFLRLHCNSSDNQSTRGVVVYEPGESNPYLDVDVIRDSQRLAEILLNKITEVTRQPALGLINGDDMTGINWAKMPVAIIEMGYMSNPEEDRYLASYAGQSALVKGMADAADEFFIGE